MDCGTGTMEHTSLPVSFKTLEKSLRGMGEGQKKSPNSSERDRAMAGGTAGAGRGHSGDPGT